VLGVRRHDGEYGEGRGVLVGHPAVDARRHYYNIQCFELVQHGAYTQTGVPFDDDVELVAVVLGAAVLPLARCQAQEVADHVRAVDETELHGLRL
jgi:hypothetical protein